MGQSQTRSDPALDSRRIRIKPDKHATCTKCRDLMLVDEFDGVNDLLGLQRVSFPGAADGREKGCCFCDLLCTIAERLYPSGVDFQSLQFDVYPSGPGVSGQLGETRPLGVGLERIRKSNGQRVRCEVEISAPFGGTIPGWHWLGYHRQLSTDSDADECFQFTNQRIQDCLKNHNCGAKSCQPLPRRVISIGLGTHSKLMLCETKGERGKYAALSYCWGTGKVLKTTRGSLDQFTREIDWAILPRTFQDAITVARKLSIQYLWIDSLCIIQDSAEDWEIESAKMGYYYEQAFITIAASSCKDADASFLKERDIKWRPQLVPYYSVDGNTYNVVVQRRERPDRSQKIYPLGDLSKRAWCFQENMLSSRILHYTSSEIVWECRAEMMSEDGTNISPSLPELGLASKLSSESLKSNPWNLWQDIVMAYSKRSLTRSSDKLPALSGIASKIQFYTLSKYFAGLWEANFMADMLWFSHNGFFRWNARKLGREYCEAGRLSWPVCSGNGSPSWSWSSIDAPVDYPLRRLCYRMDEKSFQRLTELEVIDCNIPGFNVYGQVVGGSVKATGPAIKATLVSGDTANSEFYLLFRDDEAIPEDTSEISWGIGADMCPDTVLEQIEIELADGAVERTVRRSAGFKCSGTIHASVLCLHLGRLVEPQSPSTNWERGMSYALVLGKCVAVPNTYSRLGVVEVRRGGRLPGMSDEAKHHHLRQKDLLQGASTVSVIIV